MNSQLTSKEKSEKRETERMNKGTPGRKTEELAVVGAEDNAGAISEFLNPEGERRSSEIYCNWNALRNRQEQLKPCYTEMRKKDK